MSVNQGSIEEAANNLFVVVNFMDQVRRENEKEGIVRRAQNFLYEDNPVVSGLDRIHFISAQQVLDNKLHNTQSEYQRSFEVFRSELEKYLMAESGRQIIQRSRRYLDLIAQEVLMCLRAEQEILRNKANISNHIRADLLSLISHISAMSVNSSQSIIWRKNMTIDDIVNEWPNFFLNTRDRISTSSSKWTSSSSSPKSIAEDFSEQFSKSFIQELQLSIEKISESFIQPNLNISSVELEQDIEKINTELKSIDAELNSSLYIRFKLSTRISHKALNFEEKQIILGMIR